MLEDSAPQLPRFHNFISNRPILMQPRDAGRRSIHNTGIWSLVISAELLWNQIRKSLSLPPSSSTNRCSRKIRWISSRMADLRQRKPSRKMVCPLMMKTCSLLQVVKARGLIFCWVKPKKISGGRVLRLPRQKRLPFLSLCQPQHLL